MIDGVWRYVTPLGPKWARAVALVRIASAIVFVGRVAQRRLDPLRAVQSAGDGH
jgi:hypothetical protein